MIDKSDDQQPKKSGAPLGNGNAIKHGHYRAKSSDPTKAQRLRRRVNRRLQDVPSHLRPVMRAATYAMCEVEDKLETMRDFLDEQGLTNPKGEPRRLVDEYRRYWDLWLKLAEANGATLQSFMATRKDSLSGDDKTLEMLGRFQKQVVTFDPSDVTEALQILVDAGAIRMEPNGHVIDDSGIPNTQPTKSKEEKTWLVT